MRISSLLVPLALSTGLFMACGDKDSGTDDGTIGDDTGSTDTTDTTDTDTDTDTDTTDAVDADGDGYTADEDCDDTDPNVNPDAQEVCNDVDDDCDSEIDEDAADATTWYVDADDDGYGDDADTTVACTQPDGTSEFAGDCNDADPAFNPAADESDCADPNDYNCDGSVGYADEDGDGYAACEECDDGDAAINPGADEICDDIDNDCDDLVDDEDDSVDSSTFSEFWIDGDDDGYGDASSDAIGACAAPDGAVDNALDCDDANAAIHPDATEICDDADVDEDCDGLSDDADDSVDEGTWNTWYTDADGDGFGDPSTGAMSCDPADGQVADATDCNDDDGAIHPDATEICDDADVDEDCNGLADDADEGTDESTMITVYTDGDRDGFGDEDSEGWLECDADDGETTDHSDCDDENSAIHPDATEICDDADIDENCNGLADDADEGTDESTMITVYTDGDGDGFGDEDGEGWLECDADDGETTDHSDCDDGNSAINPDATEICDDADVDEDCDGVSDDDDDSTDSSTMITVYTDGDGDGFGDEDGEGWLECDADDGETTDHSDCDDGNSAINPDATEICDDADIDEDCNDVADDDDEGTDASTMVTVYPDGDGDGFGDEDDEGWLECDADDGETTDHSDCDDGNGEINPDAVEICDDADVDEDCNDVADNADEGADTSTMVTVYPDADGDGFGDADDEGWLACDAESLETTDHSDCNDDDEYTFPGAEEVDDLYDNDCDTLCDEDFIAEGDLVISEFMADPYAVGDSEGEWVEVTNVSGGELALCGGWNLSDDGADDHDIALDEDSAIVLADGEAAVFGRSTDTSANGGAPVDYAYGSAYSLANGNDEIILSFDGTVIDQVWYDFDGDWSDMDAAGYSATLNPWYLDADDNDDPDSWCLAMSTYGDGDYGTPGESNEDECPSTCGDGVLDEAEEYDPSPGPYSNITVDDRTCRWDFSSINQLYCNGTCTWDGSSSCDDADADILCKLITGNPDSEATSWTSTTALSEHGFSCPTTRWGELIEVNNRGVTRDVYYYDGNIRSTHGAGQVVAYPVCTDP